MDEEKDLRKNDQKNPRNVKRLRAIRRVGVTLLVAQFCGLGRDEGGYEPPPTLPSGWQRLVIICALCVIKMNIHKIKFFGFNSQIRWYLDEQGFIIFDLINTLIVRIN